jgi:hypothetical protein
MKRKFTSYEIDFVVKNYTEMGKTYCSEQLDLTIPQIQGIASRNGVRMNNLIKSKEKNKTRENNIYHKIENNSFHNINIRKVLNIETKEIAYVLGLLWADGWLHKTYNTVNCQLLKNDMQELIHIFNTFGEWKQYERLIHKKIQMRLHLCNPVFSQFLKQNDYLQKSGTSPEKILEFIPDEFKNYWWRGYLDGDGCIYIGKDKNTVTFTSTYNQDWTFFYKLAEKMNIKITKRLVVRKTKDGKENRNSEISIMRKGDCKIFCDYVYKEYFLDNIGLSRKYSKYLTLLSRC